MYARREDVGKRGVGVVPGKGVWERLKSYRTEGLKGGWKRRMEGELKGTSNIEF